MSDLERVTINLIPRASAALAEAAQLTGNSKTDTVNRALQAYAFLERTMAGGGEILIRLDGETELLKLL